MDNIINIKDYYSERKIMYMATIELTTRCNMRCIHCYIDEHVNDGLSTENIFKLLDELREFGVYEIQFTGGEIFTRRDIMEIIAYARKLYFKVVLLTNISLLNAKIIEQLEDLNVQTVSTTLFSLDDDINDKITQSKKSATKIINNLEILCKTNIRTEIKTIVMKENANEYLKINEYCKKKGIDYRATESLFPTYEKSLQPTNHYINSKQLCSSINDLDCIRFGALFHKEKKEDTPICSELHYTLFIDSNGDIYPCSLWIDKIGNIFTNRIKDIWNCEKLICARNIKWKDLTLCSKCDSKDFCVRCTGVAARRGNYLGKDEGACYAAKVRKSIYKKQLSNV